MSAKQPFQNVVVIHVFIKVERLEFLNCFVTGHLQERGPFHFIGLLINPAGDEKSSNVWIQILQFFLVLKFYSDTT